MLQKKLQQFVEKDYKISYQKINNKIWFLANDIAQILGCAPRTFRRYLKNIDECDKLITKNYFEKTRQKAIFLNENGIIDILLNFKSTGKKQSNIRLFKKFIRNCIVTQKNDTILTLQTQLQMLQKKTLVLENFTARIKPRTKTQVFYIATSTNYAQQNRFKFGGVENENKLNGRLATYNTGRIYDDKFYFSYITKVVNYRQIEQRLKDILPIFLKDGENYKKEMVHCHYNALLKIIEFILNNYNQEIEFINDFVKQVIEDTLNSIPVIPEPIKTNLLEITISRNRSQITTHYINLDKYEETKQKQIISNILEEFEKIKKLANENNKCIKRKDFEKFVKDKKNYIVPSRKLWKILKKLMQTTKIKIQY